MKSVFDLCLQFEKGELLGALVTDKQFNNLLDQINEGPGLGVSVHKHT